jgi:DNA-binding LacI/PurR family transcriptional regulator
MNIMRLVDKGYKVVVTGRNFKDLPIKNIGMNLLDLARKSLDYLTQCGSKNISLLTGPIDGIYKDPYSVDIVNAFREVMTLKEMCISDEMICQAGFSQELDAVLLHYFNTHQDIDGIICLHEHILTCIENLETKGLIDIKNKVPIIDISGIFNVQVHELKNFEIRQIIWPLEQIGKAVINEFEKEWITNHKPVDYALEIDISH